MSGTLTKANPEQGWVDWVGLLASTMCMVHCLGVLALSFIPAGLGLGLGALGAAVHLGVEFGERVEWLFVILAVTSALSAARLEFRRSGSRLVPLMLALGGGLLLLARLGESMEFGYSNYAFVFAILAGVMLVGGHGFNIWTRFSLAEKR